jgi:hypothetical protein
MKNDWVYDIETYPNVFTIYIEHAYSELSAAFEISPWLNQSIEIVHFLNLLRESGARMVGFNNLSFDYPVIHTLMRQGRSDARTLYDKAMAIIGSQDGDARWAHQVFPSDRIIEQVDLFKIHHFDNRARSTSLKALEFNMRSESVEDLPFPVGTDLSQDQVIVLKAYNRHDVRETKKFYHHTIEMIEFRETLVQKHSGRDWVNFNDTKIGKEYFAMVLEQHGVELHEYGSNGRQPRQTLRPVIDLNDAILPSISFDNVHFTRVLDWLKTQKITETRSVFKDLSATVNGFSFDFGLGGVHGSVDSRIIESDEHYQIIDLDVKSYYPNLAVVNGFYPQHLTDRFCEVYRTLYEQRSQHAKGSAINAMLKLALNGVYGASNDVYSVFYDPLFTMKITLNGQLLLCKLAEMLMSVADIEMIQVNTDGLTIRCHWSDIGEVNRVSAEWESMTGLELESADYSTMAIRDVNNYIAQYTNGSVKRKGAYEYNVEWHQNASALVVQKVAEKVLLEGAPIRETVEGWPDVMDFMLRAKVPRSSYLSIEKDGQIQQLPNLTRYLVTRSGGRLFKWMPPLKGKNEWRKIGICSGWNVTPHNRIPDKEWDYDIDYDYYIAEVEKLCLGLA